MQAAAFLAPYEADSLGAHLNRIGHAAYVIADDSDWIVHGALYQLFNALSVPTKSSEGTHTYRMHLFSRDAHLFRKHKKIDMTGWNDNDLLLFAAVDNSDFLDIPGVAFGNAKKLVEQVRKDCAEVPGGTQNTAEWAKKIRACIPKVPAFAKAGPADDVFNSIWKALCSFRTQPVYALDLTSTEGTADPFEWVRIDWDPTGEESTYAAPMLDELSAEVCCMCLCARRSRLATNKLTWSTPLLLSGRGRPVCLRTCRPDVTQVRRFAELGDDDPGAIPSKMELQPGSAGF